MACNYIIYMYKCYVTNYCYTHGMDIYNDYKYYYTHVMNIYNVYK